MVNVMPYKKGLNYIVFANELIARGLQPYIVDLHASEALTATNAEFITGSTTELSTVMSGSSTKVDVISASTDDKSALSGHTRQVQIWGINNSDNLVLETISLSGTTAVSSTNTYKELNDMAGYLYGSGSAGMFDAAGKIDVGQTGKVTNECLSISAAKTRIDTARLWIPKNWRARIVHVHVTAGDNSAARSAGILLFPQWYDALHKAEDGSDETCAFFHETSDIGPYIWSKTYGNDTTMGKLTFYGQRINASETWNLHAKVIIWAEHHHASTQKKDIAGLG